MSPETERSATGFRSGVWHALGLPYPELGSAGHVDPAIEPGPAGTAARWTLCGVVADLVRKYTTFDPDRHPGRICAACVWWEAIRTDAIDAQLARLADAPDREFAVAVAAAILADAEGRGDGPDEPSVVELLAAITAHAADPLVDESCGEGTCGHTDTCPVVGTACPSCSLVMGGWAGEDEGRYRVEAIVEPPCSLVLALAGCFGVALGGAA